MSTWIFRSVLIGLALTVAGCGGDRFADAVGTASAVSSAPAPVTSSATAAASKVAVSKSSVVIAGPTGFCVDPTTSRPDDRRPFVLLGNCAAISGDDTAAQPGVKAILTASVISASNPNIPADQMSAFLASDSGRSALSRVGDPATVTVLDNFEKDGVHYVRTRDTSDGPIENLAPEYWRAYFGVNNRLVSASALGFKDDEMSEEKGLDVLQSFAKRIRDESPSDGKTAVVEPVEIPVEAPVEVADEPENSEGSGTLRGVGLLRRILG